MIRPFIRAEVKVESLSGLATMSLGLGTLALAGGYLAIPRLAGSGLSFVAISCARQARHRIESSDGRLRGLGVARLGRTLGWLGICGDVLYVVLVHLEMPQLLLVTPAVVAFLLLYRSASRT